MIILIILAVLIAISLIVAFVAYRMAFYEDRKRPEDIYQRMSEMTDDHFEKMKIMVDAMEARNPERVYITSDDGLRLSARYYHVADGAPLQIHCHGYKGTASRDFCGGNKLSKAHGHNALVIDQRCHGQSDGKTITFGIKERHDVKLWIDYAVERFGPDVQIILCGVSMGSATVLMTSGLELPSNVKGITADCPYSSPEDIILKVCRDMKLPPKIMAPFIRLGARLFGHFNLCEMTAAEAVKNAKVPILLIHGEADAFVPCEMSREIYESRLAAIAAARAPETEADQPGTADPCRAPETEPAPIFLETFRTAGHGLSYLEEPERYTAIINGFIDDCLK